MSPTSQTPHQIPIALLSAAGSNEDSNYLISAGGQPVLAHQIAALRSVGISKFLIEVESVPGTLLAMADRLILSGCSVDFIRSAQDLRAKLGTGEIMIVQAEGVYIVPELLTTLLGNPGQFIVTVDGRAENEAFERMDLNTRWAGLAVVPANTVRSIGELPEGWSITSSLLRHAMQDGVAQRPLKQMHLQQGKFRRIDSVVGAEKLTVEMMTRRAGRESGFIEAKIFSPIAAKIASLLWPVRSRAMLADGSALVLSATSAGLAGFGWTASAAIAAIIAIFSNSVRLALGNAETGQGVSRLVEPVMWFLLVASLLLATIGEAYLASEGLFAGAIVAGLTLLARQLRLPDWGRKSLQSPALVTTSLLLVSLIGGLAVATRSVAIAQLLLLIIAKWSHKVRPEKSRQA